MEYARAVWFFAVMGAFAAIYQVGSMYDVPEDEAELIMEEFGKLVEGIDALGIFLHNMLIALIMFVPGLGLAWGFVSAWSTGYVFSAISASMPEAAAAGLQPLHLLFLTPFGLMEACAYALAMSRSLLLIMTIVRKGESLLEQLRPTLVEVGIVAALLLAGGYVEFAMIESAASLVAAWLPLPSPL